MRRLNPLLFVLLLASLLSACSTNGGSAGPEGDVPPSGEDATSDLGAPLDLRSPLDGVDPDLGAETADPPETVAELPPGDVPALFPCEASSPVVPVEGFFVDVSEDAGIRTDNFLVDPR